MVVGTASSTICKTVGLLRGSKHSDGDLDLESMQHRDVKRSRYDREKRTALNISQLLKFCTDRLWLSEEHLGRPFLTNVLPEKLLELKDDIAAAKLLSSHVFGDLEFEEIEGYFDDVVRRTRTYDVKKMREHLTTSFRSRSMFDTLGSGVAGKKDRKKNDNVKRVMIKRVADISSMQDKISAVMESCKSKEETRYKAASLLRKQVRDVSHIMSAENYAFRKCIGSDAPSAGAVVLFEGHKSKLFLRFSEDVITLERSSFRALRQNVTRLRVSFCQHEIQHFSGLYFR
ncbi:hypothetical protein FGB62_25g30 [Gracilaria domingensis]|nr:hypothetical protein FGB62_25g30 [Gracilaria domingensis]